MLYFLYCLSKALATPGKKPNDPHVGATPKLKTIGSAQGFSNWGA